MDRDQYTNKYKKKKKKSMTKVNCETVGTN